MTNEENSAENDVETIEIENVVEAPIDENRGLTNDEAVDAAWAKLKEPETVVEEKALEQVVVEPELEPLRAPAEYNAEEIADFNASTRKQQEAALRLHQSSRRRVYEIQEATRKYEDSKKLAEAIAPILKARGIKEAPEVVMKKSAELWQRFEYAEDPQRAAAEYLLAKGVQPPAEWLEDKTSVISDAKLTALQERQDRLEARQAQEDRARTESVLIQHWQNFEATKNASGTHKYPDIHTPSGIQLAARVGSLVNGQTALSQQFIQDAQNRIPGIDANKLIEEAYRFYGGRVDDSQGTKNQTAQNHLIRAKRAASSKPGGAHNVNTNGISRKGSLDRDSAVDAAWEYLNSEN